jgi:hypothetical protein
VFYKRSSLLNTTCQYILICIRERPFNLKGGYGFFPKNILIPTYFQFKTRFTTEKYFELKNIVNRSIVAKFRISAHRLRIETGRPTCQYILICIRERPFNLKGGYGFFPKNILIPNVAEKNILILVEEKKII